MPYFKDQKLCLGEPNMTVWIKEVLVSSTRTGSQEVTGGNCGYNCKLLGDNGGVNNHNREFRQSVFISPVPVAAAYRC